jgi:hypothetical protein
LKDNICSELPGISSHTTKKIFSVPGEKRFLVPVPEQDIVSVIKKSAVYTVGWHEPTPKIPFIWCCCLVRQKNKI